MDITEYVFNVVHVHATTIPATKCAYHEHMVCALQICKLLLLELFKWQLADDVSTVVVCIVRQRKQKFVHVAADTFELRMQKDVILPCRIMQII